MADQPFPSVASTPEPAKRRSLDSTPTRTSSASSTNRHDHPYLIRTTSSSLLTRSNSIGSTHKPGLHVSVNANSPALGRSQGRGHKHAKSQSSTPIPLPLPPQSPPQEEGPPLSAVNLSPDVKQPFDASEGPARLRRSETLPSVYSSSPARSIKVEDLPSNPKTWTSTHLARYLSSALRVKGGGSLPAPVVRDIATFVVNHKLSGRAFLRLTQQELEIMGMNQLWRPALLDASRVLRQNVVQGRIWGFGNPEELQPSPSPARTSTTAKETTTTPIKPSYIPSVPSTVFEDQSDDGASGPEDRYDAPHGWIARGMLTRSVSSLPASTSTSGRVRDMVANLERSASGSSASENDANEISPFDFSSANEGDQAVTLSPVHEEDHDRFSKFIRRPLGEEVDVAGDEAGFASGELTSGSEAGDEDDGEDDVFGGAPARTADERQQDDALPQSDGEEIIVADKDSDSSKESDTSPTTSSLPHTPPPVYHDDPIVGLATPAETELTLHEDDDLNHTNPNPAISSPKHTHSRSPSSTLMLTSSQRAHPSFVAHISHDSGSDDTIENLIADFTAAELEPHPLAASWGANAWLDDNAALEGATARKIHEPVYRSLSRRTGKSLRSQESSSGSGSSKLLSLFEDPAVQKSKAEVSVDATQLEQETAEARKIKELEETQVRQQAMIDEFRTRLEEVERRLEEMEAKEAERDEQERVVAISSKDIPPEEEVEQTEVVEERSLDLVPKGRTSFEDDSAEWNDPTIAGLPSYVFLVGLGVAAICMRVVVKRVVGKKTPSMLGFL